jgi:hypothetical protein
LPKKINKQDDRKGKNLINLSTTRWEDDEVRAAMQAVNGFEYLFVINSGAVCCPFTFH